MHQATLRPSQRVCSPYICWTRMQAEAGEPLERIVERKERERLAGDGLFFWGVGNPPSTRIRAAAALGWKIPMLFSVMKSKPKRVDAAPAALLAWTCYIDHQGVERPLPEHAAITSRRDSATGVKRAHYALMCHSERPLQLQAGRRFDHRAYRNAGGAGAGIGASQVTALLEQVQPEVDGDYTVSLEAELVGSMWVKLTQPVELADEDCRGPEATLRIRSAITRHRAGLDLFPSTLRLL